MGRMVSLGRVAAPKPMNLPSQRLENNGQDPNVTLVPTGTHTWSAAGADDAPRHHQHPAVARSALVAHPENESPAWGSGATWGRGDGASHRPARADSFPDLPGAGAAAPSDRSLGFVDETPPGHGAHAQIPGDAGGVGAGAHAGGYGAHAGHAAYPGERPYGNGRDRGGWGDRPPPPEGWGHGGRARGGFDAGGRGGHEHQYQEYHQHTAHAAHPVHAQGYDADRDPRLRRGRNGEFAPPGRSYGQRGAAAAAAPPPPPLPPGPPPPWAKRSDAGGGGGGGKTWGGLAAAPAEPPPPPGPPPGPAGLAADQLPPGAVRVLTRSSATPASPSEFSSAKLPDHLRDLRLNAEGPRKLWTPSGEGGGRGGRGARGSGQKGKGEPKQKHKPAGAGAADAADGAHPAKDAAKDAAKDKKEAREPKKKTKKDHQPKKEQRKKDPSKKTMSVSEPGAEAAEGAPPEGAPSEGADGKKRAPRDKKAGGKRGGGKKRKGDGGGGEGGSASAAPPEGPGAGVNAGTPRGAGAGAGAPDAPKQGKKGTPKSGAVDATSKPKTKSPARDAATAPAEVA